jgi:2-polyprenyl-3-methyl-5-hydroxy-6-metoxy-1,4-benzoquinol methylase
MNIYQTRTRCRSCGNSDLSELIYFGTTPLSDKLLKQKPSDNEEIKVPLTLMCCKNCSLVQIKEEVNPKILFQDNYPYYSSVSQRLMMHFKKSAEEIIQTRKLNKNSFVFEAASNDGYMLQHFVNRNINTLGIDPASGPASVAWEKGIPTIIDFFGNKIAKRIVKKHGKADVFLANNVLAHVPDLNGFVAGIQTLLKEDGVAVIEAPYLLDLINNCEFDTIYHQHLCYFSVTALQTLFNRHNLYLNNIKHLSIHGGTIRMFIEPTKNISPVVKEYMEREEQLNINSTEFYSSFIKRIDTLKYDLLSIINSLKSLGKRIAGFGAAAKANTLMSYFGIGDNYLEYIIDSSKFKQGLYFSGNHLPIVSPNRLIEDMPDYVLILAWNFAEEIIKQNKTYLDRGGSFIVPIPKVKIYRNKTPFLADRNLRIIEKTNKRFFC